MKCEFSQECDETVTMRFVMRMTWTGKPMSAGLTKATCRRHKATMRQAFYETAALMPPILLAMFGSEVAYEVTEVPIS